MESGSLRLLGQARHGFSPGERCEFQRPSLTPAMLRPISRSYCEPVSAQQSRGHGLQFLSGGPWIATSQALLAMNNRAMTNRAMTDGTITDRAGKSVSADGHWYGASLPLGAGGSSLPAPSCSSGDPYQATGTGASKPVEQVKPGMTQRHPRGTALRDRRAAGGRAWAARCSNPAARRPAAPCHPAAAVRGLRRRPAPG